jgi:hypothetical protein
MLAATLIAVFLVPTTFSLAERVAQRFSSTHNASLDSDHDAGPPRGDRYGTPAPKKDTTHGGHA